MAWFLLLKFVACLPELAWVHLSSSSWHPLLRRALLHLYCQAVGNGFYPITSSNFLFLYFLAGRKFHVDTLFRRRSYFSVVRIYDFDHLWRVLSIIFRKILFLGISNRTFSPRTPQLEEEFSTGVKCPSTICRRLFFCILDIIYHFFHLSIASYLKGHMVLRNRNMIKWEIFLVRWILISSKIKQRKKKEQWMIVIWNRGAWKMAF